MITAPQSPYGPGTVVSSHASTKQGTLAIYQLGFDLRADYKGEGTSGGGSGIATATTQVLRAMNGLVDHLLPRSHETVLGDLSTADLATGRLPSDWGSMESTPWLWFNYNQSPGLRHQLPLAQDGGLNLSEALHDEYTRSIAVVGPDGIDTFLQADVVSWL